MVRKFKINESDFSKARGLLRDFLNTDSTSPFYGKNYNFQTGAMSILLDFGAYLIHYLSWQLNKSIEEVFLDSATIEESVYSLIRNFNYVPLLRKPAKKFLKIRLNVEDMFVDPNNFFRLRLNTVDYSSSLKIIPTFRDKWQSSYYTSSSIDDFVDKNMAYFFMDYKVLAGNWVEKVIPAFQAEWVNQAVTVDTGFTQKIALADSLNNKWMDKVVTETLRVFVKFAGTSEWVEFKSLKQGLFDNSLNAYNLYYDLETGLNVEFNIKNISRTLVTGDAVRLFYAVTEGNESNDVVGNNDFSNLDISEITIEELDSTGTVVKTLVESLNKGTSVSVYGTAQTSGEITTPVFTIQLVDENETLTFMDNGTEKQDLESIKKSAPLFFTTNGRAITEKDYTSLLRSKFSEYKDIKAWGGHKEFIDISELTDDTITSFIGSAKISVISGSGESQILQETKANLKELIYEIYRLRYTERNLTVSDVDYSSLLSGKFVRDVGFVYYSFFNEQFQFADNTENVNEIVVYLDEYKILTIFFQFMNPCFILVKPKINIKLNSSYIRDFDKEALKYDILEHVNEQSKFDSSLDTKELYSFLMEYDSINIVRDISYTCSLKVKNVTQLQQQNWIYVRFYNTLKSDINCTIESINFKTQTGLVYINNTLVDGEINYAKGMMRFKNYNSGATGSDKRYFTGTTLTFSNIEFTRDTITSAREAVVGIEKVSDIELILE